MSCKSCEERKKAYNVLHAASDVLTGNAEFVTEDIYQQRVSLCLNCPGNHFNNLFQICNICKCSVKVKAKFNKSSCPADFWGSVPTNE